MFMEVERKKESNQNVAQHLLRILRKDFDMKLNMTDGELSRFWSRENEQKEGLDIRE